MKVLITGYRGFIGTNLYNRLKNKHEILGVDKIEGTSTANPKTVKKILKFKPEIIFHLGANCSSQISLRDPRMNFVDNVVGTFNVCEVARELQIPIVFNSTMKVKKGGDGITTPYGVSKVEGEMYLKLYQKLYGVDYIINRPSCVYGPHQNGSDDGGWVTWFLKAKLQNKTINLYGGGKQARDILYIDDHIDLLEDQLNNFSKYKNRAYDFGGGSDNLVTLQQILDFIEYKNTKNLMILPGDIERVCCSNNKVNKVNGWRPKVPWVIGVNKTFRHLIGEK